MYCALKPRVDGLPEGFVGDDGWLCPKAFRKYFHDKVDEFVRERGMIELDGGRKTSVQNHLSECIASRRIVCVVALILILLFTLFLLFPSL